MRKLNAAALFLLGILFLASCQKEIDFTDGSGGGNGNGGNVSNKDSSFCPTTPGTWWKYKDSASGALATQTLLNSTKIMNGNTYRAVTVNGGSDTGWYGSPRPNYYLAQKGVDPGSGASFDMIFHYLNDTAAIGHSWEYIAGHGNGAAALMKTTIVEKGLTMTVAGKSYKNVSHTTMQLSYDIMGMIIEMAQYDFYVAKGVGIIRIRTNIDALGTTLQACNDLVDHSIK